MLSVSHKRSLTHFLSLQKPLRLACVVFILSKLAYLIIGYERDLHIQGYEDIARMYHAYNFWGFHALYADIPWLPLHPMLQAAAFVPRAYPWLLGSLFQTIVSIMGGMTAAFLAREMAGRDWRAGAATLAAWLGSNVLIISGIGYLSEPLFHLEILGALYFVLIWMRNGGRPARVGMLLSLFAMQLTRYEGWILAAAWFLMWALAVLAARRRSLWQNYKGLQGCGVREIAIMALAISVIPLSWMALNWALKGNPLFFVHATKEALQKNVVMSHAQKVSFLTKYLYEAWKSQPVVVTLVLAALIIPGFWGIPAILLILTILILIFSNAFFILKGATAFSYFERLSVTLFIPFCPLFGVFYVRLDNLLREKCAALSRIRIVALPALLILTVFMGAMGFFEQPSILRQQLNKDAADIFHDEIRKNPNLPKPYALFETTKMDYSLVLFCIGLPRPDFIFYKKKEQGPLLPYLAAHPRVRYLLLNRNPENDLLVRDLQTCRLLSTGTLWNLYEYRRKGTYGPRHYWRTFIEPKCIYVPFRCTKWNLIQLSFPFIPIFKLRSLKNLT